MGSELAVSDTKMIRHRTGGEQAIYQICDKDMASSTRYYGYTTGEGSWLIMEETDTTCKYAVGWDNYETPGTGAWASRAGLAYVYWHKLGAQIT